MEQQNHIETTEGDIKTIQGWMRDICHVTGYRSILIYTPHNKETLLLVQKLHAQVDVQYMSTVHIA